MLRILAKLLLFICLCGIVTPALAQTDGPEFVDLGDMVEQENSGDGPRLAFSGCSRVDVAAVNQSYEQEVIALVNQERWNNGQLPPLKGSTVLSLAARYHAKDLNDDHYFQHDSYDGYGGVTKVCDWYKRILLWYTSTWGLLSENIAAGYGSPAAVVSGWMGSDGHRKNILSTAVNEIGVGYYTNNYWVQDFAANTSISPMVINREAVTATSKTVALYIYGSGSQYSQMRFMNDGESWSNWMSFSNNASWDLRAENGERTVSVQFKDGAGNILSQTSSDAITLSLPSLGAIPSRVVFLYDRGKAKWYPSSSLVITPQNITGGEAIVWTASENSSYFSLNTLNGNTPTSLTLSVQGIDTQVNGSYTATLTIAAVSPSNTLNSPKTVEVQIQVLDAVNTLYLPAVTR